MLLASTVGRILELLQIKVGVDLARISRLAALLENTAFLQRVFQPIELRDTRPEHLAGVFAAKEACFKAIGMAPEWLAITVGANKGRPQLQLSARIVPPGLVSHDLSISHEGDYAVAVVVVLMREETSDGRHV